MILLKITIKHNYLKMCFILFLLSSSSLSLWLLEIIKLRINNYYTRWSRVVAEVVARRRLVAASRCQVVLSRPPPLVVAVAFAARHHRVYVFTFPCPCPRPCSFPSTRTEGNSVGSTLAASVCRRICTSPGTCATDNTPVRFIVGGVFGKSVKYKTLRRRVVVRGEKAL